MSEDLSVTPRHIDGGTLRWSLTRFGYSFFFTGISIAVTVFLTILAIPFALFLPQGTTNYTLLAVLMAILSGEMLTQYRISFSYPDTDNIFRHEVSDDSKASLADADKLILGIMIAAGVTGLFIITLIAGAAASFLSPVGSLLVPVAILRFDRYLFTKHDKSLSFAGANLTKRILRYRKNSGREIKRLEVLHAFAIRLLGISQGPGNFSGSI
jgi:archaellum biogenesis protein FlaJ (TadC family)